MNSTVRVTSGLINCRCNRAKLTWAFNQADPRALRSVVPAAPLIIGTIPRFFSDVLGTFDRSTCLRSDRLFSAQHHALQTASRSLDPGHVCALNAPIDRPRALTAHLARVNRHLTPTPRPPPRWTTSQNPQIRNRTNQVRPEQYRCKTSSGPQTSLRAMRALLLEEEHNMEVDTAQKMRGNETSGCRPRRHEWRRTCLG